jgi:hypothetical protein
LHGQRDEGPVTPALPPGQVGGGQQGVDFAGLQEGRGGLVVALLRDREHLLDELGVFGVAQGGVAEQRPQRGEAGVAAARAVVPVRLEVVQERGDHLGAEVVPVQGGRRLARAVLQEAQQKPERVPR